MQVLEIETMDINVETPEVRIIYHSFSIVWGNIKTVLTDEVEFNHQVMATYTKCFEFCMEQYKVYLLWVNLFNVKSGHQGFHNSNFESITASIKLVILAETETDCFANVDEPFIF